MKIDLHGLLLKRGALEEFWLWYGVQSKQLDLGIPESVDSLREANSTCMATPIFSSDWPPRQKLQAIAFVPPWCPFIIAFKV